MSLFDLSSFVGGLSPALATVTRYGFSYDTTGKAAAKTVASTFQTPASFQPQGKKWKRDPEGFNESENRFSVFTQVELKNGDRLAVDTIVYEVENVEVWNALGSYCEATCKALNGGEA